MSATEDTFCWLPDVDVFSSTIDGPLKITIYHVDMIWLPSGNKAVTAAAAAAAAVTLDQNKSNF